MGSEVHGPGAQAAGPLQVTAPVARAWAVAAARAAARVPARCAEADAWIVRGWADVAVGCLALDGLGPSASGPSAPGSSAPGPRAPGPSACTSGAGAYSGLDEVVRAVGVVSGGQHAARLRQLRRFAGPVPLWYPDARPVVGPVRRIRGIARRAADLVSWFGELLMTTATTLPRDVPLPFISARQLAWGVRYRPSASHGHVTLRLPVHRRLARRTWMCLPGLPGRPPQSPRCRPPPPRWSSRSGAASTKARTLTTSRRWPGAIHWRPARGSSAQGCSSPSRTRWPWRYSPRSSASWRRRATRCGSSAPA